MAKFICGIVFQKLQATPCFPFHVFVGLIPIPVTMLVRCRVICVRVACREYYRSIPFICLRSAKAFCHPLSPERAHAIMQEPETGGLSSPVEGAPRHRKAAPALCK
jgi:hypothetical protein